MAIQVVHICAAHNVGWSSQVSAMLVLIVFSCCLLCLVLLFGGTVLFPASFPALAFILDFLLSLVFLLFFCFVSSHLYVPVSEQAVVTGVVPSPPWFLPSILIAHSSTVQQSHFSLSIFRVLLTHALALSVSQFLHKKKSPRIYSGMHSGGFELKKLTYTRLEDNLIHHRGDPPNNPNPDPN